MSLLPDTENQAVAPVLDNNYWTQLRPGRNVLIGKSIPVGEQMRTKGSWIKVHTDSDEYSQTDRSGIDSQDIDKALQKVRTEAEEERRLDPELDSIPETAYKDVEGFFKTVYKPGYGMLHQMIPLPDIMPLDDGEIGLEWRKGQKIFTLSFGGDGHIVVAGIFSEESRVRGILTFSANHVVAIASMIASVYPHYVY